MQRKMKNKNNNRAGNNFTQQTHFIGVLLPEDITLTLEDFPVDNVTIFERQGGKWVSAVSLELGC